MDTLLAYTIKATALLSLVWLFYAIALHRNTFHTANRWFFILGITLSLLLPCVSLPRFAAANPVVQQAAGQLSEWDMVALFDSIVQAPPTEANAPISAAHLIIWCLGIGVVLFLGLFCIRLISFFRLTHHANQQTFSGANVFFLRERVKPFSLFGSIFLNPDMHSEAEITEIIAHEIFHIKQKHTLDIILAEVMVILFWFNPFAWLLRKAIRQNLEYLADRHVLNSGCDIQRYQYILVRTSIAGISGLSIAHNFTFSNLKKRILMMNKKRTPHTAMVKYLLLIPLIAFAWIGVHAGEITRALNEIPVFPDFMITPEVEAAPIIEIAKEPAAKTFKARESPPTATVQDTVKKITRFYVNGSEISWEELKKREDGVLWMYDTLKGVLGVSTPLRNPIKHSVHLALLKREPSINGLLAVHNKNTQSVDYFIKGQRIFSMKNNMRALSLEADTGNTIFKINGEEVTKDQLVAFDFSQLKGMRCGIDSITGNGQVLFVTKENNQELGATKTIIRIVHSDIDTIRGGNEPLFIVDGKEIEDLKTISPDEIESITVLKDAASLALYGEKARNGVVMIITKVTPEKEAETTRIEHQIELLQKQIEQQQEQIKQLQELLKRRQEPIK